MHNSFKLGRVAGIEIGVHYTWLIAFALISWSLAEGHFAVNYPGWGTATYWLIGILSALALFSSVLIHELSHSFVALAQGQGVHSITLFIFGGVSNLKEEPREPKSEFLVAIVGPLTSFVLAGLFWVADTLLAPGSSPLGAALGYLASINLMLGLFNLLPGFPLDGGRVFRSIVWGATGSLRRATRIASFTGQGIGFLMIFAGVSLLLGGNVLSGLWIAFIGWFLNGAAESTRVQQVVTEQLRGVRVTEVMNLEPAIAQPDLSIEDFVFEHVLRQGTRAMLVSDAGGVGIVSISDVRKVPRDSWATTPVTAIMTPPPLRAVSPDADLEAALGILVEGTFNQVPVVQDGQVVGILSRADVLRFLQLREEFGLARTARGETAAGLGQASRE